MTGADFGNRIAEFLMRVSGDEAAAIEQAAEQAIQGGEHGVAVWRWRGEDHSFHLAAAVDPSVPYGYIHEHSEGEKPPS